MKSKLLLIILALALPAVAGTSTYQSTSAPAAPSQPSLWSWFIGGSAGYLIDAEAAFYSGHVGVDTPWSIGGWSVAMLAEVGYFEADNIQYSRPGQPLLNTTVETDALPVTFGLKFERPLSGNLSAYVGGNLGAAFLDMTATRNATGNSISENSAVFTASVFAGLVYNVSPSFEIFGGARWIYFDDTDIGGWKVDLGDDVLLEGGLRFNF